MVNIFVGLYRHPGHRSIRQRCSPRGHGLGLEAPRGQVSVSLALASEVKSSALALASKVKSLALASEALALASEVLALTLGQRSIDFEAGHNICLLGLGQDRRQLRINLHVQCSAYMLCILIAGENASLKCMLLSLTSEVN